VFQKRAVSAIFFGQTKGACRLDFEPDFFIKGIMIGFAIAAPVGPIGVLCIKRTLLNGVVSGLASGMGAALADCLYGAIAAFSLTAVAEFLRDHTLWIQALGGLFLVGLGIRIFLQKPRKSDEVRNPHLHRHNLKQIAQDFISTFFLTLTNPATILSFVAIFAGLGLVSEEVKPDYETSALMVAGVFLGSLAWWCILCGGIGLLRHRLDHRALRITNIISSMIIIGFGLLVFGNLLGKIFKTA
jgi:threonine/homoserine/homoserine lactone efflux protein